MKMKMKFAERISVVWAELVERLRVALEPIHLVLNSLLYLAVGYVVMTLVNSFGPVQARGDFDVGAAVIMVLVGFVGDVIGMNPEARKARSERARTRLARGRSR